MKAVWEESEPGDGAAIRRMKSGKGYAMSRKSMKWQRVVICFAGLGFTTSAMAGEPRMIRKEVEVKGTAEQVFRLWTTPEGIAKFFSPESKIELRLGGAYDLYMSMKEPDKQGKRGAEGSRILGYIENEMLAFDWTFPPAVESLRSGGAKTQVVLRLNELGNGRVRVRLVQHGWGQGADWDKGFEYFDAAWGHVLRQLKEYLDANHSAADGSTAKSKTWDDQHVKVTSTDSPIKRQEFEMIVPVPVEAVWNLLATTEGFKMLGAKEPLVELRPGGAYSFWPGAPTRVLAFVPGEMLCTSGSAPPEFPNVRKGGTWSAYYFESIGAGKTKLRLSCTGWRPGEKEWDDAFNYFLKNNPVFLNSVYGLLVKNAAQVHSAK
jgi:uncharacterized protein YndB with AHSA1/START domain